MPTTLADIAKALGVSKMTVSRAINNHPEISPDTRARILEAAQRMNYRPNQFARALTQYQRPAAMLQRALQQHRKVTVRERLQHVNRSTREQRAV